MLASESYQGREGFALLRRPHSLVTAQADQIQAFGHKIHGFPLDQLKIAKTHAITLSAAARFPLASDRIPCSRR